MATTLSITRFRGDTVPDQIAVKAPGAPTTPFDVTGFTFLLTVNSQKAPTDETTQLFQIAGVIEDAPAGLVNFTPTVPNAAQAPGKYFFDIQMTDSGGLVQTIVTGTYKFTQDITKD